jgi:hypothetical protein
VTVGVRGVRDRPVREFSVLVNRELTNAVTAAVEKVEAAVLVRVTV